MMQLKLIEGLIQSIRINILHIHFHVTVAPYISDILSSHTSDPVGILNVCHRKRFVHIMCDIRCRSLLFPTAF